ncbi:hypothetical protein BDV98DRAFT_600357 [Pterulicium gracile]|uniref:Uncharacterized protein n=1 Tax=Pterulicium gracile TaxID=1884261 RepID=A0A5C3R5G0_9AGAR|nr:hypothetical protein BDV98DRAFT_600357 [Pterula gracilis]
MARTTRSNNAAADQTLVKPSTLIHNKKRKRSSVSADPHSPTHKQSKTDPDLEEDTLGQPSYTGDAPLDPVVAHKILDILQMIDTQGLLDRVFPLQADSSSSSLSYSFRTLLSNSPQHSLSTLRSAVCHLFPLSSQHRSKRSAPAAQQLQFCNLALSLLDQASLRSHPSVEDLLSIFPQDAEDNLEEPPSGFASTDDFHPPRRPRYALVQHLATTDWWTSLHSDLPSTALRKLTELNTANANLVTVLTTPAASTSSTTTSVSRLGSYNSHLSTTRWSDSGGRKLTSGSFLDYGPHASFAPSFEQDGRVVGKHQLGEVLWRQQDRRRQRGLRGKLPTETQEEHPSSSVGGTSSQETSQDTIETVLEKMGDVLNIDEALEDLLSPEQVESLKSALASETLERAVDELLERNQRALRRLQELQYQRLIGPKGGESRPTEGTEEWETAHSIAESLAVLASLRPRSSLDSSSLLPPASILRRLSRTLPEERLPDCQGTLPPTNPTALRDDSTVKIKPYASTTTTTALPPPTPATPTASQYPAYSYGNYPQYRPNPYSQYQVGKGAAAAQPATSYYGNAQYPGGYYPPQASYANYASWYNYGAASGQGTPQAGSQSPAPYAAQTPARVPVVGNTITAPLQHTDAGTPQQVAPTLPAYLRATVGQGMGNGSPQQYGQQSVTS